MNFRSLLAGALVLATLFAAPIAQAGVMMQGTVGQTYVGASGTKYTPDATGTIASVDPADARGLLAAGVTYGDANTPVVHTASVSVPVATINSGGILFNSSSGRSYQISSAIFYASGGTTGCTSVALQDANDNTPFMTVAVAGLSANGGAVSFVSGGSYITPGSAFALGGKVGSGVSIVKNGSSCTGLTDLLMKINYTLK